MSLTHVSLFSGIGCSDLAAEWAGFKTVLMCEIDEDCQKVLNKHFPGVPIIEDVRNVTRESVITNTNSLGCIHGQSEIHPAKRGEYAQCDITRCNKPTSNSESTRLERQARREPEGIRSGYKRCGREPLTLLTAGVPCQPASSAGKRRGKADDRWLWPEAIRVLSELQPTWAVFENPVGIASLVESSEDVSLGSEADQTGNGILSVELLSIIRDIEACGYEVQPVSISACGVGAPHKRQRIFIIAHSMDGGQRGCAGEQCGIDRRTLVENESERCEIRNQDSGCVNTDSNSNGGRRQQCDAGQRSLSEPCEGSSQLNPDSQESGLERPISEGNSSTERLLAELGSYPGWQQNWTEVAQRLCSKTQPGVRSLDAGTTPGLLGLSRVSKLKMLGNCNPPQLYYPIYKAIAEDSGDVTI